MAGQGIERIMPESKEWLDEPDREDFEHAGYKCLVLRHDELGHLCGYAAVPKGHPLLVKTDSKIRAYK